MPNMLIIVQSSTFTHFDRDFSQAADKRNRSSSPTCSTSEVTDTMSYSKTKEPVASPDMCTFCFDVLLAHHFKKVSSSKILSLCIASFPKAGNDYILSSL